MRDELEEASAIKIQTYIRKVVLPRRMAEKMQKPDRKLKNKKKRTAFKKPMPSVSLASVAMQARATAKVNPKNMGRMFSQGPGFTSQITRKGANVSQITNQSNIKQSNATNTAQSIPEESSPKS